VKFREISQWAKSPKKQSEGVLIRHSKCSAILSKTYSYSCRLPFRRFCPLG